MPAPMSRRQFARSTAALAIAAGGFHGSPIRAAEPRKFNESIEKGRQAALDTLMPTPAQLEHGLELHAQSIVFDAYGFSPRSATDGAVMSQAIASGMSDFELQDLTEEMSMTRCVTNASEQAQYREGWEAAGMTCIFQNAGEESSEPMRLIKRLARFTFVSDHLRDFVFKAVEPADIERAKRENRHCLYMTGNGVPLAGDTLSVPDELRYVRVFQQLGIRMMHVTYQRRNLLGDGCAELANGGLSDLGRAAVAEMNRLGVIVDVAHSGWRTSLESAQTSKKPMVASHTVCDALNHHIRAKPVEVIKAICDTGGLVGICCISNFLGGKGDIVALLDHIGYVVERFGIDHVAIGSDVGYSSQNFGTEQSKVTVKRATRRPRYESFWPEGALSKSFPGAATIAWTNWPLFTVGLVQRGYKDADIQKILGQNMLRVCRENYSVKAS